MIPLGSKVKCKITGFTGIAVARVEFINGCTQYEVAPPAKKDGTLPEPQGIDEQSLEVIKNKKKTAVKKKATGGKNNKHKNMRGW